MRCVDPRIGEHLVDYVCETLSASSRAAFESHLKVCAFCAAEVRAMGAVRSQVRAALRGSLQSLPPARMRERVMAAARAAVAPKQGGFVAWLRRPWFIPAMVAVGAFALFFVSRETLTDPDNLMPRERVVEKIAESAADSLRPAGSLPSAASTEETSQDDLSKSAGDLPRKDKLASRQREPRANRTEKKAVAHPRLANGRFESHEGFGSGVADRGAVGGLGPARGGGASRAAPAELFHAEPAAPFKERRKSVAKAESEAESDAKPAAAVPASPPASLGAANALKAADSTNSVAFLEEQAQKAFDEGRFKDALKGFETLLRAFPRHPSVPVWKKRIEAAREALAR